MGIEILVVDESQPLRRLVCRFLAAVGIAIPVEAASGREAVDYLATESVQLIIVDWNTTDAELNGLELLTAIRDACPGAKLVVMSTEASEEQISAAYAAGAADYLIKPFDVEARQRLLRLCQQERPEPFVTLD